MSLRLPPGFRAESLTEVRRSRFLTTLARVDSEESARAVIAEVRHRHPDARHHCTAFVVEASGRQPIERSNDDGEPSGTAGRPMLAVLTGRGLTQVVAVVTRWFGGVKLGTGGLTRAYAGAVEDALAGVRLLEAVAWPEQLVRVAVGDGARVDSELRRRGATVLEASYGSDAELRVAAPWAPGELAEVVAQLTGGRGSVTASGATVVLEDEADG